MTNHRQTIPLSQRLFSLLEEIEEVGEIPCQNFPDLFFPEVGHEGYQYSSWAKKLCADCPVLESCRSYAIDSKEQYGIWGGLTPIERRAVRSKQRNSTSSRTLSPSE